MFKKMILKNCDSSTRQKENSKGVSINAFCISNNDSYTAFKEWSKKMQKKVVPIKVEGLPTSAIQDENVSYDASQDKAQRISKIIIGRYHRDFMNGDVYMFT